MQFSKKFVAAGTAYTTYETHVPAPYMRRVFTVQSPAAVEITICGLGFYDLYINGQRITKGILAPYISNPDDVLYYDAYDLLPYIRPGKNVLGLVLGNGMLNCPGGEMWDFEKAVYRSAPKVAFALEITERDGGKTVLEADENVVCTASPILLDDLRIGEWYDARREIPGWAEAAFDDGAWTAAIPAETPRGDAVLCQAEPIRPREEIAPVRIWQTDEILTAIRGDVPTRIPPAPDETGMGWLFDFGVNTAGLTRLRIRGEAGQKITIQYGEWLTENGGLDLRGMCFMPLRYNHRDQYICRGGEEEVYMPSFTYHGFRYCLVYGLKPAQAVPETLTMVTFASDLQVRAGFSCSEDVVNRVWNAGMVSNLANFYYFPTDCPHREKNGWTGDASLSAEQMTVTLTVEKSFHEWMRNIRAAQAENGELPGIVPTSGWGFAWGNGPGWDTVTVNIPWALWTLRGDRKIILENAEMICRYLEYVSRRRDARGLLHIGLGDWVPAGRSVVQAPLETVDTILIYDYAKKAAEMFRAVSLTVQAAMAEALRDELYAAARRYLVNTSTMTAYGDCQTSQALAIYYGIFTPAECVEAVRRLTERIHADGDHSTMGIFGMRVLFRVLAEYGYAGLAYRMLYRPDYPSYGNWIARGATSLWEDFQPEGRAPNSLNHHFMGDVLAWNLAYLAGIRLNPCGDGPQSVKIAPLFVEPLTHAEGWCTVPAEGADGRISVSWKREEDEVAMTLAIPAGVIGDIEAPRGWKLEDGRCVTAAKSGTYRFLPDGKRDKGQY